MLRRSGRVLPKLRRQDKARRSALEVPFLAWDLEALDWNRWRCAAAVTDKGDVETFGGKDRMADYLREQRRRCYAHFGGRYDFFFLPPCQQVILSGSGVLKAQHG